MDDKYLQKDNITKRIRLLILSRLFIVTFILGIAAFAKVNAGGEISDIYRSALFITIISVYIASIGFFLVFHYLRNVLTNIYIQGIADVIAITAMVFATGGINSLYSVFYPLVIIYTVTFLGRGGGLLIASASAIFYGFLAVLEYYSLIVPAVLTPFDIHQPNAGYVLARVLTHITSFYFTAFLSIFVVDQEKKTKALLAEKQDAFTRLDILHRSIIESIDAGIMTVNPGGRIKSFNRSASKITGFDLSEVENQRLADIFPDFFDFLQKQKQGASNPPFLTRFEGVFNTSKGKKLKLGASLSPLRDPQGRIIGEIIIFEDIAEIIDMRESLEKSRRQAFTGEVAANLAHEIRNPLAAIGGSIQLLLEDTPFDHVNQKLFDIIMRGKEQLESFLKDFLLLARPAPGICEEVELQKTIIDVIDSLRLVPDWRQELRLDLRLPEAPLLINVNKTEIRQVLWNLTLNALQAMPAGGVLTIEVALCRKNDADAVQIRISDDGCGIDKIDLRRIFEPFYTTREVGTGLGLAVVSRIIENWQGTITVESESGKGTTFAITFPPARSCPGTAM
ncbi:MAG: PAS domain S-box protein [Syntrophobacterales bacterium]|nr:PAS domain S-box protein [Syntrophobacterales bacterium]